MTMRHEIRLGEHQIIQYWCCKDFVTAVIIFHLP